MTRLEHIGIAVREPAAVAELLERLLGIEQYKTEEVLSEGVRTHFLDAGGAKLELLEALNDSSPVARFLERRGEGVHHLAFEVDDVADTIRRGRELGLVPLSEEPIPGADGKHVAFFHPKSTHGVLIEVCESIHRDETGPREAG